MTIQTNAIQGNESEALCNARCTYLRERSVSNLYLRYLTTPHDVNYKVPSSSARIIKCKKRKQTVYLHCARTKQGVKIETVSSRS